MNWSRKPLKTPILLKSQVPWLVQLPGTAHSPVTASARRKRFSTSGWLVCYSSATLHATAASLDLHTPPLAAQKIRRAGGGLLSQHTPLKRPQATLTSTTPRTAATLTTALLRIVTLPTATRTVSTSTLTLRGRSPLYR